MSGVGPEPDPRAAEYVLRLLEPAEEAAFEATMRDDRALQTEVAEWIGHFEALNVEFAEQSVRNSVKARLMERLFDEPRARAPFWQRIWVWQGVSLAALVLAAVLGVQALLGPGTVPGSAVYVSEIVAEDQSLRLLAVYDPSAGGLRITRTAGEAPEGRVLELWAIRGDAAPVSLGVLPEAENAAVPLPEAFRDGDGLILAISEEPPGGSTTGAPTGAVLAVGEAVEL